MHLAYSLAAGRQEFPPREVEEIEATKLVAGNPGVRGAVGKLAGKRWKAKAASCRRIPKGGRGRLSSRGDRGLGMR